VFESPFLDKDTFHEIDVDLRGESFRIYSRPGVFSWDHLDEATQILAEHMMVLPGASVLDLGCGSGPLGVLASRLSGGGPLVMVDADVEAVRSATKKCRGSWSEELPDAAE
jgi:16S RNA G1207 methylase RsmC